MIKSTLPEIEEKLAKIKRVRLAQLPTALEKLDRLGQAINMKHLWIKRDDNTGLAFGGNKARKLEFLVADAMEKGSNLLLTVGGVQSNHARMTAAAARAYGLDCCLWLLGKNNPQGLPGNLLLDKILGARVEFHPYMDDETLLEAVDDYFDTLKQKGSKPYYIPMGGSTGLGDLGYVMMVLELAEQLYLKGETLDKIILAAGSGGTLAGLTLGCKLFLPGTQVWGISIGIRKDELADKIIRGIRESEHILGISPIVSTGDIHLWDDYIGEKYAVASLAGNEAIIQTARTQGILLDPVYTGKAMAGLIDLRNKGVISASDRVCFVHTGGTPALFAYEDSLAPLL